MRIQRLCRHGPGRQSRYMRMLFWPCQAAPRRCMCPAKTGTSCTPLEPSWSAIGLRCDAQTTDNQVMHTAIPESPWERALRPSGAGPDSVAGHRTPVNAFAFCSPCLQRFPPCLRRGGDTGPGPLLPVVAVARWPFYPCLSGFPDPNPFRRPLWGTVCAVIPSDDPGL